MMKDWILEQKKWFWAWFKEKRIQNMIWSSLKTKI